jgi:hypothetical protein
MKLTIALGAVSMAGLFVLAAELTQPVTAGEDPFGPDVLASRLGMNSSGSGDDFHYYGSSGGIRAFSISSTSCNEGEVPAEWVDTSPNARNPVIAQNLYRLNNDRFEQIGMAWCKHSFCAVSEPTCTSNCQSTSCDTLGVGCADTYWATLNGSQSGIGPRWHINPQGMGPGGVHNDIYNSPTGGSTIGGRLQVHDTDIIPGSRYFAEIQYATHDEDLFDRFNNASFREVNVSLTSISGVGQGQGTVQRGVSAIMAWEQINPDVTTVQFEDVPGEGRFDLAYLVTDNEDGTWTYEYALHNLNSHKAAGSFNVPMGDGAVVSSTGFHDVDYHSGDGIDYVTFDGTDWPETVGANSCSWATTPHSVDDNSNALRWGTLYNYRITCNAPPVAGTVDVGLYRFFINPSVSVAALVPGDVTAPCLTDLDDSGATDVDDLLTMLGAWGTDGAGADVAVPFDLVDVNDLLALLAAWGDCL